MTDPPEAELVAALREDVATFQTLAEQRQGRIVELERELREARRPLERAIASLLDVVEELAQGLAHGQTPTSDWADVVSDTFQKHGRELRGEAVDWDDQPG